MYKIYIYIMDLGNLQANALQSINTIKENPVAYYGLIIIVIVAIIVLLVRQYKKIVAQEKAEPIFIRNIKNAYMKPIQVPDTEIQTPLNGSSFTFSTWLYVNDFNKKKKDLKHVFHKGDLNMNTMAPGVFIAPDINSIAILVDTQNRVKSTVSTKKKLNSMADKAKEDVQGIFPMDNACGCEEILKIESDYKMASFVKDEQGNGSCYLYNKERETVANDRAVSWTKLSGNVLTMNPYENSNILLDDNSCVIVENIPLQRWFHLVVVVNTSSVEVYVDGKLYKTLVLQSPVKLNSGGLYSGLNDGYDGMINELRYFPHALRYIDVYNMYTRGPTPFYFMYMFRGKTELYEKHLKDLQNSLKDIADDAGGMFSNLSEDIFGEAVDYS
jgi:hypothetical protein